MAKGVRKYGPEPAWNCPQIPEYDLKSGANEVAHFWFPHIFSEAVDCANQTGLFADALGVELCQTDN